MTRRMTVATILSVVLVVSSSCNDARGANHYMPKDLQALALGAGCAGVPAFYDRPGMVTPPYVYGVLEGEAEDSAAFWCYRKQESPPYALLVVVKGAVKASIPWRNFPGGLSVDRSVDGTLEDFRYIKDPDRLGPRLPGTGRVIHSEYDGVITLFTLYDGQWLFRIFH